MGVECFSSCENLTSVTFSSPAEQITSIPTATFVGCHKLSGFVISEYITAIGASAFNSVCAYSDASFNLDWTNASNLTSIGAQAFSSANLKGSITVPDTVEAIGYNAFWQTKIEELLFGEDSALTILGNNVAGEVSALKTVKLPKGITEISSSWFDRGGIENLDLSATKITAIPDNSFSGNYESLKTVSLPEVCTSIGYMAFNGRKELVEVKGSGVTSVGRNAFYNCDALTTVDFFDTLVTIGDNAFTNCKAITTATFGNGLVSIGNNAFKNCDELGTVSIQVTALTKIGDYCFSTDKKLTEINFTGTAIGSIEMGQEVFFNCVKLTSIIIPEGVTKLGSVFLKGCSALTSITIPSTMKEIGASSFIDCNSLVRVNISDVAAWCNMKFGSNAANPLHMARNLYMQEELVTSITIPNSVTSIGKYAFYGCSSLTAVVFGSGLAKIDESAFFGCSGLLKVTITDTVTDIGNSAFSGCSSIESVKIGSIVATIGKDAFSGCSSSLGSITVAEGNTTFRSEGNCLIDTASKKLVLGCKVSVIPSSVTSIGNSAFSGCSSLTSITIPDSVKSIGNSAFSGCSSLTSITIPGSVTSIGSSAFLDCSLLTSINYDGTKEEWGLISKGYNWNNETGEYTVTCTDGSLTKSEELLA